MCSSSESLSIVDVNHLHDVSHHRLFENPISKFENLEFSFSTPLFDSGIHCHNSSISTFRNMEADCEDQVASQSNGIVDMNSLFEALSAKFTSETTKLSKNFQTVADEHDLFKQEVLAELDYLQKLVLHQSLPKVNGKEEMNDNEKLPSSSPVVPSVITSSGNNISTTTAFASTSSQDLQQQMMMMMTESFTKLSMAISESKQDVKTEWPKFGVDSRKFRSWYLGIMTQLALSPWQDLYDPVQQNVVTTTQNSSLNAKL